MSDNSSCNIYYENEFLKETFTSLGCVPETSEAPYGAFISFISILDGSVKWGWQRGLIWVYLPHCMEVPKELKLMDLILRA